MSDSNDQMIAFSLIGVSCGVALAFLCGVLTLVSAILISAVSLGDGAAATIDVATIIEATTSSDSSSVEGADGSADSTAIPPLTPSPDTAAIAPLSPTEDDSAAATDEQNTGRIVIVSENGQVVTVNPDGGNLIELTSPDAELRYLFPSWSPDGQSVAAIYQSAGLDPHGIHLLADSAETLTNDNPLLYEDIDQVPIYLSWAPNGDEISFIVPSSTALDLRLAPIDGSTDSRILLNGAPLYWDWTTTSDSIFVHSGTPFSESLLSFVDPASGLSDGPVSQSGFFQSPDISADDALIAYANFAAGEREVVIENRNSGEQVSVAHNGQVAFHWSPTDNQLAYIAPSVPRRSAFGPLSLINEAGDVTQLTNELVIAFFWSPDGEKIAYLKVGEPVEPQIEVNFGRTRLSNLQNPIQEEFDFIFEFWIADVESNEHKRLVAFIPSLLFIQQFLPFFDQYAHSHSIWSPNSDAIVLPVFDEGTNSVYRIPLDGGVPTRIADGIIGFWSSK